MCYYSMIGHCLVSRMDSKYHWDSFQVPGLVQPCISYPHRQMQMLLHEYGRQIH